MFVNFIGRNANRCYSLRTTYLIFEVFQIFFSKSFTYWLLQLRSCFIKWYEKQRSIKLWPLRIHNSGCLKTLTLLHVSSSEMFKFCDVLHETKQNKKRKQTLERSQYVAEIIFKVFFLPHRRQIVLIHTQELFAEKPGTCLGVSPL